MHSDTTTITTLITMPPDLIARDRARRQALRAGAVEHPGLAPLRSAAFAGEGLALTWQIPAGSRARIESDDPLAVLAPIAAGLALLHDAGLAHGGIASGAVHVSSGHGVLTGWRPGGSQTDDVAHLVALLDAWVPRGSVGADLVQVLIAGGDPDPAARPSMARLAAAIERGALESRTSAQPVVPISPPAQRRARLDTAPPARAAERVPAAKPARQPAKSRGRHAARRTPGRIATSVGSGIRIPWRWGLALAGSAAMVFLGLSALGSTGTAQEICPAPSGTSAWTSLLHRSASA